MPRANANSCNRFDGSGVAGFFAGGAVAHGGGERHLIGGALQMAGARELGLNDLQNRRVVGKPMLESYEHLYLTQA